MIPENIEVLKESGKVIIANCLTFIQTNPNDKKVLKLLDEALLKENGKVLGITGPPGVGKSSLINRLVDSISSEKTKICIIAVDPSSDKTGGALLGDRARYNLIEGKSNVFIRSMSNKAEFGGLSEDTYPSIVLMKCIFDFVIVETVGAGQAEIEIENFSDLIIYCAQPASGDFLQYMKSGIMEIPDIVVVTKLDLGKVAYEMVNEIKSVLMLSEEKNKFSTVAVSSKTGKGFDELMIIIKSFLKKKYLVRKKHEYWIEKKIKKLIGEEVFKYLKKNKKLDNLNFSKTEELCNNLLIVTEKLIKNFEINKKN